MTKSSNRNSTTAEKRKPPKAPSRKIDLEDDTDNRSTTPEPTQRKLKNSSSKLLPTQTDDESDDLAIKKPKAPNKVDKEKARAIESPPETFESAGTDVDLEDPHPGSSNLKTASNRWDASEGAGEQKPLPKKRGRPRKGDVEGEPPPKRGKTQKVDDSEAKGSTKSKPKRQAKKVTKGRARKEVYPSPDASDAEKEPHVPSETKTSGSNTRKRQRRTPDDSPSDEKQDESPDSDQSNSNPSRVRLDSIPPEGVVIRKKNGIAEILLPPVMYIQFRCFRRSSPNLHIVVDPRGRLRVTGGRPGVLESELFPPMF